jgi:uncharacterized membrane protein YhaH (DUF805 family)
VEGTDRRAADGREAGKPKEGDMDFQYLFFNFDGRIDRGQWWIGFGIIVVAWFLASLLFGQGLVYWLIWMVLLVASLGIHIKRLHDRGKAGLWVLVFFIPVIGFIWMIVEMGFLEGDPGPNEYGPPPVPARG